MLTKCANEFYTLPEYALRLAVYYASLCLVRLFLAVLYGLAKCYVCRILVAFATLC